VTSSETEVRQWLEQVVIGLDLCPFAAAPWRRGAVRLVTSDALDEQGLLLEVQDELLRLDAADPLKIETTLILILGLLADFDDFNQFLDLVDRLLDEFGWQGRFQAASFHPDYRFADTSSDDGANLTNRAPCPILHLIREDSISRAIARYPNPDAIPERNVARMRDLTEVQRRALFPFLFSRRG
jgi:hypothetical protein